MNKNKSMHYMGENFNMFPDFLPLKTMFGENYYIREKPLITFKRGRVNDMMAVRPI
jgi:hypothetical protein